MQSNTGVNTGAADLRAALRVADLLAGGPTARGAETGGEHPAEPAPPDHRDVARLLAAAGSPAAPHAWRPAWDDVLAQERAGLSRAGLGWVLTRFASGMFPALDILETGCERLRLSRLLHTAAGPEVIRLAEASWTELAPASGALPQDRGGRLFLLAGGRDQAGGGLGSALRKSLGAFVRAAGRDAAGPLVLAVRAAGWQPVEQAAEAVRGESGALLCLRLSAHWPMTPDDLTAGLPLRTTVWLAAAHVDGGSGTVGLVRRPLFPAGSRADDRTAAGPVVHVPVTAPPQGATTGESVAAVVLAGLDEPASRWRSLRIDRLELPPGSRTTLCYALRGLGRVELRHDGPHEPETSPWTALASGTPRQLSRPRPVDLVVAVEVAGPQADGGTAVEERLQEAAAVVTAVQDAVGVEETLRVGLIGYRDHDPLDRPGDRGPVVRRLGMSAAPDAALALASWRPRPLRHDFATGLEHVPRELSAWRPLWRADSHRVLLVVGSRPPHPRARPPRVLRRGAAVRICPDRLDWQAELDAVRHYDGVACVAVVDEPAWMDDLQGEPHLAHWADHAWHAFGAEGRFTAGHDPRLIASAVAAPALCLPADGTPIRLVVADGTAGDWQHAVAG
ncbi:hypothetical protein ACH4UM_29130 [Streptomyces sp. NPDC020801]|uniref:hypothetical protein n=1 Tax=Streptomyces sp. NPDC020801 TaxID=3365093 RepID=UPI003795197E